MLLSLFLWLARLLSTRCASRGKATDSIEFLSFPDTACTRGVKKTIRRGVNNPVSWKDFLARERATFLRLFFRHLRIDNCPWTR